MTDGTPALPPRHSRVWLFAPFVLLALAVAGWSTAWFLIRNGTTRAVDDWLAAEAAQGRQWQCIDRTIGGYPFRITVSCDALSLQRNGSVAGGGREEMKDSLTSCVSWKGTRLNMKNCRI